MVFVPQGSSSPPSAASADPNAALHEVPSTRLANITVGFLGPRALLTTSSSAPSWLLTTGAVQALERPAVSTGRTGYCQTVNILLYLRMVFGSFIVLAFHCYID